MNNGEMKHKFKFHFYLTKFCKMRVTLTVLGFGLGGTN